MRKDDWLDHCYKSFRSGDCSMCSDLDFFHAGARAAFNFKDQKEVCTCAMTTFYMDGKVERCCKCHKIIL